jgi:hypothetical protein
MNMEQRPIYQRIDRRDNRNTCGQLSKHSQLFCEIPHVKSISVLRPNPPPA